MDDAVSHLQELAHKSIVVPLSIFIYVVNLSLSLSSNHSNHSNDSSKFQKLERLSKRIVKIQRQLVDDDVQLNSKKQRHIRHVFLTFYIPVESEYIMVRNKSIYINGVVNKKLTGECIRILKVFNEHDSVVTSCVFYKIRKTTNTQFVFLLRRLFMDIKYSILVGILNRNFTTLQIKVSYLSKMYAVDFDKESCGTISNGVWNFDIEKLGKCIVHSRPKVGFEFVYIISEKICTAYGILDDVTPHALCQNLMSTVELSSCAERVVLRR